MGHPKELPSLGNISVGYLIKLQSLLKKTILSKKFYLEVNEKILSKTSTVDKNLYFICYFTLLVSSILKNKPQIRRFLKQQKFNLLKVINSISINNVGNDLKNSNNKIIANLFLTPDPSLSQHECNEKPPKLAENLGRISSYISDIRIFNRLTSTIEILPWMVDEYLSLVNNSSKPLTDRFMNFIQAFNCFVLEVFENIGWISDHNWINTSDNGHWSLVTYVWSSRVWGVYLVFEILELFRSTPRSKWDKNWKIKLFQQAVQLPLVLHWSLYNGCLTPFWVGLCGSGASWFQFKDIWMSLDLK